MKFLWILVNPPKLQWRLVKSSELWWRPVKSGGVQWSPVKSGKVRIFLCVRVAAGAFFLQNIVKDNEQLHSCFSVVFEIGRRRVFPIQSRPKTFIITEQCKANVVVKEYPSCITRVNGPQIATRRCMFIKTYRNRNSTDRNIYPHHRNYGLNTNVTFIWQ